MCVGRPGRCREMGASRSSRAASASAIAGTAPRDFEVLSIRNRVRGVAGRADLTSARPAARERTILPSRPTAPAWPGSGSCESTAIEPAIRSAAVTRATSSESMRRDVPELMQPVNTTRSRSAPRRRAERRVDMNGSIVRDGAIAGGPPQPSAWANACEPSSDRRRTAGMDLVQVPHCASGGRRSAVVAIQPSGPEGAAEHRERLGRRRSGDCAQALGRPPRYEGGRGRCGRPHAKRHRMRHYPKKMHVGSRSTSASRTARLGWCGNGSYPCHFKSRNWQR